MHLAKIDICEEKVLPDKSFGLQMQWLSDETLLIPGQNCLGFLSKDEDDETVWEPCYEERVQHPKLITSVIKLSNEVLITYSKEDSLLKIWRLNEEGCSCIYEMQYEKPLVSICYDEKT